MNKILTCLAMVLWKYMEKYEMGAIYINIQYI